MDLIRKTVVIIPCFNEAKRFAPNGFIKITDEYKNLHFLFVDDGSTDDTGRILRGICLLNPAQMHCMHLPRNSGKAEAVRRGFLKAFEEDYDYIGFWDADLATPLVIIPKFIDMLERPDVQLVFGSRVRLLGRDIERRAVRHYAGRVYATCASLVLGLAVYDTQCGAKLFKHTDLLEKVFHKPFQVKWSFDVEIFARFLAMERKTGGDLMKKGAVEYPLEVWKDIPGSKVKPVDFFVGIFELLLIYFLYLKDYSR